MHPRDRLAHHAPGTRLAPESWLFGWGRRGGGRRARSAASRRSASRADREGRLARRQREACASRDIRWRSTAPTVSVASTVAAARTTTLQHHGHAAPAATTGGFRSAFLALPGPGPKITWASSGGPSLRDTTQAPRLSRHLVRTLPGLEWTV